jgi:hypothetical protein
MVRRPLSAEQEARWREASPLQYVRRACRPCCLLPGKPRFSVGKEEMMARMQQLDIASSQLVLPETPHVVLDV